ncbi:Cof subfamily of IIB subfamily of haloacid dehalogenase superfamily/HAD-superfamily hydrolase, subfamily IIB [Gracilibacillus ureilyticus]|uniref:Cof subfamily of IIB subfamily of haloacid dehalogenase superfamily/HAD-superfamily hydrolase, subfamily IIB n=1 Tax=Gracilibacillus ureilyticus TaxID=531814 RepID=A0A1H9NET9_9BACI|nr:Cof-type HAD-IIB family hydrolase [Gracilibacillus ureilyticus]SER34490.1 Cof subfamily of IIB subfamily of haloacid dehalogenase superfamily/HAD-superfamily hydrolase, subfamily IIB [Gracilibacillus ureilyticus]
MDQKVIFLDVDGTLANDSGIIPDSAYNAINLARENGHLIFLSTGRSKAELFDHILEIGFDGIIGAAGGYIEVENEVIFHQFVEREAIEHLVRFFNHHNVDYYLESNGGLFASENCKLRIEEIINRTIAERPDLKEEMEQGLRPFQQVLKDNENLIREDINKISFLGSDLPFEFIQKEFESKFEVIPSTVPIFGENSGELSIKGINKAIAIERVLKYLKKNRTDTFAYGDGLNDLEMLAFVQHGIAMGNARSELKEIADDITFTPDQNGLFQSFKKYGLI